MIDLFSFSISAIPSTLAELWNFILGNPILCGILFASYFLHYAYQFINYKAADSEVYEIDLLSSGISTIMIAFLLIGLDESAKVFNFSNIDLGTTTTLVAVVLFIYALLLILFAFVKILPRFLVILLGNSEVDLLINFVAILMIDPEITITGTTLLVIAVPLLTLLLIQRLRRLMP